MRKYLLISFFVFAIIPFAKSQNCTTLGQNPETAFPVCGTTVFTQGSVAICGTRAVPSQCVGTLFTDKNPYWYKFTCFQSGTLGFLIRPNTISDDYDWQLFDVTGRNPQDIYSDVSLFVACNWSGEGGETGASSAGTSLVRCEGPGVPLFSSMPTLITGHNYLLLVSHFSDSQDGYKLSFGGGTADITDPIPPHMLRADAACDGTKITVKLNKKMKCRSLQADGSEFKINTPTNLITGAIGVNCDRSFDMDQVELTLASPLAPGNYTITIDRGTDAMNTLHDNCDREIPRMETIPLVVFPLIPTPMDSLTKLGCSPQTLELVFKKPILCSSIDGTEFSITGPYSVGITSVTGNCVNGLTSTITIQLSAPLQVAGNFLIHLKNGSIDNNTIFDECSQQTPPSSLPFVVKDTVNANFTYNILYGCQQNTVQYLHNGSNGVNSWLWSFDGTRSSDLQNPIIPYTNFEEKQTQLIVSNGMCSDTSNATIFFDNLLQARFEATSLVCPGDRVTIRNTTVGNITNWAWDFGNGLTGNVKDPAPQIYNVNSSSYSTAIKLIVTNNYGCKDSMLQIVRVINNCFIAVPSAFSPNGDGLNDYLYPLNAYKALNLEFSVYNRFGQRLFYTRDWTNKWDGKFKGNGADPGTYVWILRYINSDTNKPVEQKGTTVLIR